MLGVVAGSLGTASPSRADVLDEDGEVHHSFVSVGALLETNADGTQSLQLLDAVEVAPDGTTSPAEGLEVRLTTAGPTDGVLAGCDVTSGDSATVIAHPPAHLTMHDPFSTTDYVFHRRVMRSARPLSSIQHTQDNMCVEGGTGPSNVHEEVQVRVDLTGAATSLADDQARRLKHGWVSETDSNGGAVDLAFEAGVPAANVTVRGQVQFLSGGQSSGGTGNTKGMTGTARFPLNVVHGTWEKTCGILTCRGSMAYKGQTFQGLWEYPDTSAKVGVMIDAWRGTSVSCRKAAACDSYLSVGPP